MRHGDWQALGGADTEGVQRWGLIGYDGATVHGWVQAVRPGEDAVMGYASADLDEIEAELKEAATTSGGEMQFIGADGVEIGLFGIGKALKKLAKKTGVYKVIKKATKLADYALQNPLVKGALAATGPMGLSILAAHQGYRMLKKFGKGHPKAMRFVKGIVRSARGGNPKAIKIQRMLRMGQRAFGPGALRRYAVRRAGTPARYGTRKWGSRYRPLCPRGRVSGDLEMIAGADVVELGQWMQGEEAAMAGETQAIFGAAEDAEVDEDIKDLNEFVASAGAWEGIALLGDDLGIGAWEGLEWIGERLSPHSMAARPNEMTARDALLDGRQGQAARFA